MGYEVEELNMNDGQSQSIRDYSMTDACDSQKEDLETLVGEVRDSFAHYLRKRPVVASSLVFLAGFYVGWKIKPW